MKRALFICSLLLFLCFLLLSPQTAAASARYGLALWYQNLVPVLFPFMILSNLMIRMDGISFLIRWIHPLLHLIWGTSLYGSYAILAGFLFGYPMGAKVLHDLLKQQLLSQKEAEYLIGFVNNLSPVFIITFLVGTNLKSPSLLQPTLCILYGAPLLTSMVFAPKYRKGGSFPDLETNKASKVPPQPELIDACVLNGIVSITRLGAYIMLFSMIAGAVRLLPLPNVLLDALINGCIEITAGIPYIWGSPLPLLTRYLCLMSVCSFGGICALMQTLSIFPMKRQMLTQYLKAKVVTVLISLILTFLLFL